MTVEDPPWPGAAVDSASRRSSRATDVTHSSPLERSYAATPRKAGCDSAPVMSTP